MSETDATALEERLAHLERTLADLSEVVARQDREIDGLRGRLALILAREAEREAESGGGIVLGDERPPHY